MDSTLSYINLDSINEMTENIYNFCNDYSINENLINLINQIPNYNFGCIIDDSSSMNEFTENAEYKFDELKDYIRLLLSLLSIYNIKYDLNFLNYETIQVPLIRSDDKIILNNFLSRLFSRIPYGYSNVYEHIYKIYVNLRPTRTNKPLIILIFINNISTNNDGHNNMADLKHFISNITSNGDIYIKFILFSNNYSIKKQYYKNFKNIKNVSIIESYKNNNISYGNYLVKFILDHKNGKYKDRECFLKSLLCFR